MNFRHQLLHHLNLRKLTAAELSRRSGVSKQSISDWLAGVQPRSIPQVKKVADVFAISLDALCFGKEFEQRVVGDVHAKVSPKASNVVTFAKTPATDSCLSFSVGFDGFLRSLSPRFSQILGWSADELQDRPIGELVHFSDRLRTFLRIARQAQSDSVVASADSRYLCKNGEVRWLRWNAISSHDEKLVHVAGRDVSDQYPTDIDPLVLISPEWLVQDAVFYCNRAAHFSRTEYKFNRPASKLIIHCRQAQIASAIVMLLHETAMCAESDVKNVIELNLIEAAQHARFEVRVPWNNRNPNLDIISLLIRNQNGMLETEKVSGDILFRVDLPQHQ